MANVPFKGEFHMDTQATGAATTVDYSCNYVSGSIGPEANLIDFGPFLCDNFRSQEPGSFAAPVTFTLQKLSQAQILVLHGHFNSRTLMEVKYMHTAGTVDTPTTTNMQWDAQFYLPNAPPIPMVVDELASWEFTINATYAKLDDGASPQTYGTAA